MSSRFIGPGVEVPLTLLNQLIVNSEVFGWVWTQHYTHQGTTISWASKF